MLDIGARKRALFQNRRAEVAVINDLIIMRIIRVVG
jgi:hypothetical protein